MDDKKLTFKELILKPALTLFGAHIGGIVMAFIFCMGLGTIMNGWGFLFAIPVVLIVYSIPVYNIMWGAGNRDLNRVSFGHTKPDIFRGLKIALLGNSVSIIFGLVFFIFTAGKLYNICFLFRILNSEIAPILMLIQQSLYPFDFTFWQTGAYFLLTFLPVLIAAGAYILGYKDFSIGQKLVYKNNKK